MWLNEILQRQGYDTNTVERIRITHVHDEQLHSISYRFEAQWQRDTPRTVPTCFFLKLPRRPDAEGVSSAGAHEVAVYQFLASHAAALPIVPCYDAVYDAEQRRYHLLLADLSHSHDQPTWHLTIGDSYVQRTVDCLAQLHAYWWDRSELCRPVATLPTAEQIAADVEQVQTALPRFVAAAGELLTPNDIQLYERIVHAAPGLWERRLAPQHPTLAHGDAHFWNFLYPHADSTEPTYVLDWPQAHIDWGVSDLAYTLVLRYPHRTRANEHTLVQRYHVALTQHGVTYSWDECWRDYCRAAVEQMLVPIQWCGYRLPEALWKLFIPRTLAAYRDLAGEAAG
ncbi:MAG: phosphotransferase [Chloroflexales bacterium]|nr:phosphotransferase [Chloroflexales bacterium]